MLYEDYEAIDDLLSKHLCNLNERTGDRYPSLPSISYWTRREALAMERVASVLSLMYLRSGGRIADIPEPKQEAPLTITVIRRG